MSGKLIRRPSKSFKNDFVATLLNIAPAPRAAKIPIKLPQKPIKTASRLNRLKTVRRLMPNAFARPISRVLSLTAINNVLTIPKVAAMSAIAPKLLRAIWNI